MGLGRIPRRRSRKTGPRGRPRGGSKMRRQRINASQRSRTADSPGISLAVGESVACPPPLPAPHPAQPPQPPRRRNVTGTLVRRKFGESDEHFQLRKRVAELELELEVTNEAIAGGVDAMIAHHTRRTSGAVRDLSKRDPRRAAAVVEHVASLVDRGVPNRDAMRSAATGAGVGMTSAYRMVACAAKQRAAEQAKLSAAEPAGADSGVPQTID